MRRRSTTASTTPDTKRQDAEHHRESRQGGMEAALADSTSPPGSPTPAGGPLQVTSPDRVNRRESRGSALRGQSRDSTVHDKISQFNSMSVSMQSRALERKTADAALKRALIGREEAEAETRRLKEETRTLRKALDEGKERERRVGERLEAVMENFGRAKETHAHTQTLWEKEIRRSRKENFKAQSSIVKLQEELKTSRETTKTLQESLQREKERTRDREQEAVVARNQLASLQEQLDKTLELIKVVEQERDAYKAAAKNEEIARIAAEGRIPLPASDDNDDEFASPPKKKARRGSIIKRAKDPRMSLTSMEIVSSAATELEIEELGEQVQWERQRADRAQEMVEFMQAECLMHCCPCSKSKRRASLLALQEQPSRRSPGPSITALTEEPAQEDASEPLYELGTSHKTNLGGPILDPIFFPKEGFFRTVSEQDAIALAKQEAESVSREPKEVQMDAPALGDETDKYPRLFARTPSVEPPSFALQSQERTSLLSLINAPRGDAFADALPVTYSIPTLPDTEPALPRNVTKKKEEEQEEARDQERGGKENKKRKRREPQGRAQPDNDDGEEPSCRQDQAARHVGAAPRPETFSTDFSTGTTTTKVPVRKSGSSADPFFFGRGARTASTGSNASFDHKDPAMIPTVTREQALAMIRERRGRARSATQLASGPGRKAKGKERRDMSAPTEQAAKRQRRS